MWTSGQTLACVLHIGRWDEIRHTLLHLGCLDGILHAFLNIGREDEIIIALLHLGWLDGILHALLHLGCEDEIIIPLLHLGWLDGILHAFLNIGRRDGILHALLNIGHRDGILHALLSIGCLDGIHRLLKNRKLQLTFFKWANTRLFYHFFSLFKQTSLQFLQQICVKKCPSLYSNPWPSEHESPPVTTRPGLLPSMNFG